jgi:hypothetical protein
MPRRVSPALGLSAIALPVIMLSGSPILAIDENLTIPIGLIYRMEGSC